MYKMTKYFYLRSQKGQISNKSININENGFLYIVTGEGYVQECLFSIKSLDKNWKKPRQLQLFWQWGRKHEAHRIPRAIAMTRHCSDGLTKSANFFFTEWGFPGGQIVPTTCRSILHPSKASQLPYNAKTHVFRIFYISRTKSLKVCPSNGRLLIFGQKSQYCAVRASWRSSS